MKTLSKHKGLAMVEFTILLPLLLLLLISIMEMGRAFYTYTELEKLTRDSVRYLSNEITDNTTGTYTLTDTLKTQAANLAVYGTTSGGTDSQIPSLSTSHVTVSLISDRIQIEINYPFQPVLTQIPSWFTNGAIDLNFNMTSSYTMRLLQ